MIHQKYDNKKGRKIIVKRDRTQKKNRLRAAARPRPNTVLDP